MADAVRTVIGRLVGYTAAVSRDLALEIAANLVEATPKDTGWAASNWIPTTGAPATEPSGAPGDTGIAGGAQSAAIAALATRPPLMTPYYVANGVPYIRRLNNGSSQQAPAGFVQAAIAAAEASVTSKT